jgi:hypothetical protein
MSSIQNFKQNYATALTLATSLKMVVVFESCDGIAPELARAVAYGWCITGLLKTTRY